MVVFVSKLFDKHVKMIQTNMLIEKYHKRLRRVPSARFQRNTWRCHLLASWLIFVGERVK